MSGTFSPHPKINVHSGGGISYNRTSYNDTQIVADLTVASGTPDEDVDVNVTSNGSNGLGFQPVGGGQATGSSVRATVQAPAGVPEVTVVAWVDGSPISLPSGANTDLVNALQPGASAVYFKSARGRPE